jgi:NDP-sugar pyrophosphorylase family protein
MRAMILAAGFGTRLFPLTIDRTKPAIPFLGRPLVGYVAEYVAKYGFKDVVVNLHHQPESVRASLGDGSEFGVNIQYTLETPDILGTAGALDLAKDLLKDETFLIVNGKIITDIDLTAALETHRRTKALATMVLKRNVKREKFSTIETEGRLIKGFGKFPVDDGKRTKDDAPLMFTGIHILEPEVFNYIPQNQFSDIISVFYRPAIAEGKPIVAHVAEGMWFELSTIPRYLDITLAVLNGENNGLSIGENVNIAQTAEVRNSIIWDNVTIEPGAKLNRAILADNVRIKAGEIKENVAIVPAALVGDLETPEKALKGYFEGENYVVPLNQ